MKIYDGLSGKVYHSFSPFDQTMTAGVRVGSAFVNDDIYADVVVASGKGAVNEVRVFDGKLKTQLDGAIGKYTPFGLTRTYAQLTPNIFPNASSVTTSTNPNRAVNAAMIEADAKDTKVDFDGKENLRPESFQFTLPQGFAVPAGLVNPVPNNYVP